MGVKPGDVELTYIGLNVAAGEVMLPLVATNVAKYPGLPVPL